MNKFYTFHRHQRFLLFLPISALMASCMLQQPIRKNPASQAVSAAEFAASPSAAKQLTQANNQIVAGEFSKSGRSLEEIISQPQETGVTDEALLKLALLNLRTNTREGATKSHQLLQRLSKEFPQSAWTPLIQPVIEQIETLSEHRRQIMNLKGQNQLLNKETKELHQTIERLKSLDLELERKSLR